MVYLYAALGVVMMTGIMAVVEMGLSLTGQSPFFDPLPTPEQENSMNKLKELDKSLLGLLYQKYEVGHLDPLGSLKNSPPLKSSALCDQVLCRINRPGDGYCLGEKENNLSPQAPLEELSELAESVYPPEKEWSNSCALEVDEQYRFLIRPDSQMDKEMPYYMYSCALKYEGLEPDSVKCDFEASL